MARKPTPAPPPAVDLLLLQPVTYAGEDYPAGATLPDVPRVWADWMIDLGVAQPATSGATPGAIPDATPDTTPDAI